MVGFLWEGAGVVFTTIGCRRLSNAFPLGCGTRLCFVRENCRLSLWEMEAEYLLLLGCCLVGYFTDFWMRAVQNAGNKAFSVHS